MLNVLTYKHLNKSSNIPQESPNIEQSERYWWRESIKIKFQKQLLGVFPLQRYNLNWELLLYWLYVLTWYEVFIYWYILVVCTFPPDILVYIGCTFPPDMRYSWKKAEVKNTMSMAVILELPSCENTERKWNGNICIGKLCHGEDTAKILQIGRHKNYPEQRFVEVPDT